MSDSMNASRRLLGYCTNVHAGRNLAETRAQLETHAFAVKRKVAPGSEMGIGLWLSAACARDLLTAPEALDDFAAWLHAAGLTPFTFNGFPYGDFHQETVKHRVYLPTWDQPERLDYTRDLVRIMDRVLPPGVEGSISTLPLGWSRENPYGASGSAVNLSEAAGRLIALADTLADLERNHGRLIHVDLEPEPGCLLQFGADAVRFFEDVLLRHPLALRPGAEVRIRRHLRICHDLCHAAVMFEEPATILETYRAAGLGVGKIQVSSAVRLVGSDLDDLSREQALNELRTFAENRYLHQTVVRDHPDAPLRFYEDLSDCLAAFDAAGRPLAATAEWRVHFHVPVYLSRIGCLSTTQGDLLKALASAQTQKDIRHYELETYAWDVLPDVVDKPTLAEGIAAEYLWVRDQSQIFSF